MGTTISIEPFHFCDNIYFSVHVCDVRNTSDVRNKVFTVIPVGKAQSIHYPYIMTTTNSTFTHTT